MKRPVGVSIIGVLAILNGVARLLGPLAIFGVGFTAIFGGEAALAAVGGLAIVFALIGSITGVALIATGVALFRLRPWAWTMTLVLAVISLVAGAAEVVASFSGGFNWGAAASAAIPAVILLYHYRPEVQDAFGKYSVRCVALYA